MIMKEMKMFYMRRERREWLIERHKFYVDQSISRVIRQFDDIANESRRFMKEEGWLLAIIKVPLVGDRNDYIMDLEMEAVSEGRERNMLLEEMRTQAILNIVVGMYHEWDKSLRRFVSSECILNFGEGVCEKDVWGADFRAIEGLLESMIPGIRDKDYFRRIDACRLISNVYKHGDGKALEDLRVRFPEYLGDPYRGVGYGCPSPELFDHSNLCVSEEQFIVLAGAITDFWSKFPEFVFYRSLDDLPTWFVKAASCERRGDDDSGAIDVSLVLDWGGWGRLFRWVPA